MSKSNRPIPPACRYAEAASSCHKHFSRFTSWWRLTFWHHEQEQSFYSSCLQVCRSGICKTTTPMFLCCARKNQKKLSRLPVGESVRIIEGSSWQPCTTSLALKSGSLGVKTQRVPTILRFGNRDFNMRSSPCVNGKVALCSSHFFHSRSMAARNKRYSLEIRKQNRPLSLPHVL